MTQIFGYKHWTLENPPRCFNVGKGVKGRARSMRSRNHKWHAIVKRLGLRVEVCVGPMTNDAACTWEIEWIAKEKTFNTNHLHDDLTDIGCNFTHGGDGSAGCSPSAATRKKMSKSHMGNTAGTAQRGKPKSEAHKQAIRVALKGNPKVSEALRGNQHTLGKKVPPETLVKRSATLRLNNQRRSLLRLLRGRFA